VIITAPRVIPALPQSGILEPGYVVTAGDRITGVGAGPPPGPPDVELAAGVLAPGLVDLQVNGYFGVELMAAEGSGWAAVAEGLPATGCTAFLPTFITAPLEVLTGALGSVADFLGRKRLGGARALGVHLEGPFISPARRGAHNPDWIIPPTAAAVDALLDAGAGLVRLVTLAPEADGAMAAIARLAGAGVLVSVGHSDATAEQVAAAAGAGARMVTHLFNAQRPLHHREPGVVGQALADHRLTSGLIVDLHHVSAVACAVAFAAAPGRIGLVTDAAACAGMPPGEYLLGGEPIVLPPGEDEPPRRLDGTLAGSALRMDRAVANMVALLAGGDDPPEPPAEKSARGEHPSGASPVAGLAAAVAAASRIPADLIGRPELGRLAPGAAADLVWLDDDLRTAATWIDGEKVYP
jgi:N-acetylglucosamine-6-phosphate deacetylase